MQFTRTTARPARQRRSARPVPARCPVAQRRVGLRALQPRRRAVQQRDRLTQGVLVAGQLSQHAQRASHDPRCADAASERQLFGREARRSLQIALPRAARARRPRHGRPQRVRVRRPRRRERVRRSRGPVPYSPSASSSSAWLIIQKRSPSDGPVRSPRAAQRLPGPLAVAALVPGEREERRRVAPCARCPRCRTAPRPPSRARAARSHRAGRRSRGSPTRPRGRRRSRPAPSRGGPRARGSAATPAPPTPGSAIASTAAGSTVNVPRSKAGISSPSSDSAASAAASCASPLWIATASDVIAVSVFAPGPWPRGPARQASSSARFAGSATPKKTPTIRIARSARSRSSCSARQLGAGGVDHVHRLAPGSP